jgi:hypothetical protein
MLSVRLGTEASGSGVVKADEETFRRIAKEYAFPRVWQVNGGSHFLGEDLKRASEELNIVKVTTPAYAPFVNDLIENTSRVVTR